MAKFDVGFWDEKFEPDHFVYGEEATVFLREQAHHLAPKSHILVPADGEGRNSVFLASLGHSIVATDRSDRGLAKARRLAESKSVEVDYRKRDIHSWEWPKAAFDAVVAIFIQFSEPKMRSYVFDQMQKAVRPGGLVFLHGYTQKQLEYGTGGPPVLDHLYTEELLQASFTGWQMLRLEAYERVLEEGTGHVGQSALIDLIARRPAD
ncbi:MAG: class I SAM-dependent methyltransferase [Myxococcota bacterium]